MKIVILLIHFGIVLIYNLIYPQIFSEEPIIKVRIIYTLDSLNIIFNNDWILSQDKLIPEMKFNKDDSILVCIEADSIVLNNFSSTFNRKL